jgi:hypothetical protein
MHPNSDSTCSGLQRIVFPHTPVTLGPKMEGIGNVDGFDGAVFNSVFEFAFGEEAFVTLTDGLNHGHGIHGLHVDVGESAAYAALVSEEGDLFALGAGDDPIATSMVADCEPICLQLGEREEVGNSIVY